MQLGYLNCRMTGEVAVQEDRVEYFNFRGCGANAEAWLLRLRGRDLVYVPLHSLLVELDEDGVNNIEQFTQNLEMNDTVNVLSDLIANKPAPTECTTPTRFMPTLVALGLTDFCNLACLYCHSDARASADNRWLSTDAIECALKLAATNAAELGHKFEVSFTGPGEPTAAWELLIHATQHAEALAVSLSVDLDLSMASNGFYGDEKRNFLVQHFSGVSLSFDGIEEVQDLHRRTASGHGTFNVVYKTAKYFYDRRGEGLRKFRLAIRATISKASLARIDEIHDFFSMEFPGIPVGYEMLNPLGRGQHCSADPVVPPDGFEFANALIRLGARPGLNPVVNSGAGRVGELKRSFCKALAMPSMNINPAGEVLACQRDGAPDHYQYGYFDAVEKQFIVDEAKISQFRSASVDSYPECAHCIAKYHCAGDCNDLRRAGISRCIVNTTLVLGNLYRVIA